MEPDLVNKVAEKQLTVSAALVQQRTIVFHSFNAIVLARHAADAAVLLQGFFTNYCHNSKLVDLLTRRTYN